MNEMEKVPALKLTRAQIDVLRVARDHGHALAMTGCRSNAGGARRRMVLRLRDQGLLTWRAPYMITEEGREALLSGRVANVPKQPGIATCIGCGCTDNAACVERLTGIPCHWVRLDRARGVGVCSACPKHVARWDAGDHTCKVASRG